MLGVKYATFPQASSAILLSIFITILPAVTRGDDLTGATQDDPKDLLPAPPQPSFQRITSSLFQPMPVWARGVTMPPLPDQLKPMGKKTVVQVTPPAPAPPLAPPVETTAGSTPAPIVEKPKAPAAENPDLITVSPFLQWIKSNPQAAAIEARQQANGYRAPYPANPNASNGSGNPGGEAPGAPGGADDNYWLPPLIDSADFGTTPVGGSAAIYRTPQR